MTDLLPPAAETSGDLRRTPLAQLLWDLARARFSGSLVILAQSPEPELCGEATLAFEEGLLAQVRLPRPVATLGEVLVELGVVTEPQRRASAAEAMAGDSLQGAALAAMGACDAPAVERGLRAQLGRKLTRLFSAVNGPWEAHPDVDLLEGFGGRRFPVEVPPLLWPAMRANAAHPVVGAVLERLGTRRLRILAGSAALALLHEDVATRAAVDGLLLGSRVAELLAAGHAPDVVRPLVALLAMTRQLERVRSSQRAPASLAPAAHAPLSLAPAPPLVSLAPAPIVPTSLVPAPVSLVPASGPPAAVCDGASLLPPPARSLPPRPVMSLPPLPALGNLTAREPAPAAAPAPAADPALRRDRRLRDADLALAQQRPDDAEREARAVLAEHPNDVGALVMLARALLARGDDALLPEVRDAVTAALNRAPQSDAAFVVTGKMLLRQGDARRALGCYVKAYRLNPRNVEAARAIRLATARRRAGASTDAALANVFLSSG
ncbi:MAG: hypothetical protein U0324_26425 [Polyangiales bacterium]